MKPEPVRAVATGTKAWIDMQIDSTLLRLYIKKDMDEKNGYENVAKFLGDSMKPYFEVLLIKGAAELAYKCEVLKFQIDVIPQTKKEAIP